MRPLVAALVLVGFAACSEGQVDTTPKGADDAASMKEDGGDVGAPSFDIPTTGDAGDDLVKVVDDAVTDSADVVREAPAVADADNGDTPRPFDAAPDLMPTPDASIACPAGQTACGARCVDLTRDPIDCGRCGGTCTLSQECYAGACTARCDAPGLRCGGACVDGSSDNRNCGACGRTCGALERCTAGRCVLVCPAGQTDCGGRCVDTATDATSCGACGNACASGMRCRAGSCVPTGVGAPCDVNTDCDATAPTCFPAATGWQGGYCTRQCAALADCPSGTTCVSDGSVNFCLRVCTAPSGCRAGYVCRQVGPTTSACYPSCTFNAYALCGAASCNTTTGACRFVCASNADCTAGSVCNTASPRRCACTASTNCGPGRTCFTSYGYCGCVDNSACGADAICDPTYGICRRR